MFKYPDQVRSALSGAGCLECGSDVDVRIAGEVATTECPKHGIINYGPDDETPHFEHIKLVNFRFLTVQKAGDSGPESLFCPYCGHKSLALDDGLVKCKDCGTDAQGLNYL